MHFIQKTFLNATQFYLHYEDYANEMAELAEALTHPYNQLLEILAESGVDAVLWSANVDDMITYASLYEKHFMPWCHKAAETLSPKGIFTIQHPTEKTWGSWILLPSRKWMWPTQ